MGSSAASVCYQRYARFAGSWPSLLVVLAVIIASIGLTVAAVFLGGFPSFSNVAVGFEATGTKLSSAVQAWNWLDNHTSLTPSSARFYRKLDHQLQIYRRDNAAIMKHDAKRDASTSLFGSSLFNRACLQLYVNIDSDNYAQYVFEVPNFEQLMTKQTFDALCRQEMSLFRTLKSHHKNFVQSEHAWSLPSYVTCLSGRANCSAVTESDISAVKMALQICAPFRSDVIGCFKSNQSESCKKLPDTCQNNMYADLFYYILSINLNATRLYTASFLPFAKYFAALKLNHQASPVPFRDTFYLIQNYTFNNDKSERSEPGVLIRGIDIGNRLSIFKDIALADVCFTLGLCFAVAVALCLLYTASLLFTFVSLISFLLSGGVTYFFYRVAFNITAFPFTNVFSLVFLMVASMVHYPVMLSTAHSNTKSGSIRSIDDGQDATIYEVLATSNSVVAPSCIATVLAFASLLISDVVAVKCFAAFSAILFLTHTVQAVTVLPFSLILIRKYTAPCIAKVCGCAATLAIAVQSAVSLFSLLLLNLCTKLRYLWFLLFTGLMVYGAVVIVYRPGATPADRGPFQVLRRSHPIEWMDQNLEDLFQYPWTANPLFFRIVWGLKSFISSTQFNSQSTGTMDLDPSFHLQSKDTLDGFTQICRALIRSNLTRSNSANANLPCLWLDNFHTWSQAQKCPNNLGQCCNISRSDFSSKPSDNHCLLEFSRTSKEQGPFFEVSGPNNNTVVAFALTMETRFSHIYRYEALRQAHQQFDEAVHQIIASTNLSVSLKNYHTMTLYPELSSWLDFQDSLFHGLYFPLLICLATTLLVLLVFTGRPLIVACVFVTVPGTVLVTMGALVLAGWHLNMVECTLFMVTIAVSIDVTCFYAFSMARHVTDSDWPVLCGGQFSLAVGFQRCALPCIASAIGGVLVALPLLWSQINALYQLGVFLMTASIVSYLFASFYLSSLLCIVNQLLACISGQKAMSAGTANAKMVQYELK